MRNISSHTYGRNPADGSPKRGLTDYRRKSRNSGRDVIAAPGFLGDLVGAGRATILVLIAGGIVVGEVTGVSHAIRQQASSVLMTPPRSRWPASFYTYVYQG